MVSKAIPLAVVLAAAAGVTVFLIMGQWSGPASDQKADITIIIPKGASTPPSDWGGGMIFDRMYYDPPMIKVVIGVNSTIQWVNMDSVSHTVTSVKTPSGASSFDSGLIAPGSTFTTKLSKAGIYTYYCTVHPWAGGLIEAS
jgi:hypothetical protein